MSRHRNIRSMNYEEEYDGYDDVYGHSVEDDHCVSPATASQFLYERGNHALSSFITGEIPEEEEGQNSDTDPLQDSSSFSRPQLSDTHEAKLNSCLEEMRNVVGESTPEHVMVDVIMKADFSVDKALNLILNQQDTPKPQRERRERRNRGGRCFTTPTTSVVPPAAAAAPPSPAPKVVVAPSAVMSEGLARMTFATGSRATSGFSPEDKLSCLKMDTADKIESAERKGLCDRLDDGDSTGHMNTANGEAEMMVTPKKSRSDGGDDLSLPPPTPKSTSKTKRDPKQIEAEYEKRKAGGKEYINLVVIGHVDAGKSTMMGHVLYQLGFVNKKTMHKYEQESKKQGKASFVYAWVLDETEEERTRGVTMDVAQTRFETKSKIVTLLDAPGHKDFIPNMITGAAQADVAILVVNATRGEFETGFETGGQTREHAMLIRSLGVSQLIVAVNKMDTVSWEQARFADITKRLGSFLRQAGFREADVRYVPCSGLSGENLTKAATEKALTDWYSGPHVAQLIDELRAPSRQYDRPYRQCISDVFKGIGAGISVAGTLQAGCIQTGDKVIVMPQAEVANVKSVSTDGSPVPYAFAGDNATVVLTGIDITNLSVGSILCDPSSPVQVTSRLKAKVVVFNIEVPITKGFQVVFHYQSLSEPAVIRRLISQLHKSTGEVLKKKPRCLTRNTSAMIEVELDRAICVELYSNVKDLGRFMLRYGGCTIAAGLVTEIVTKSAKTE